jgi:hypothetical protein
VALAIFDDAHGSYSSNDGFVSTGCSLKLFDKVLPLLPTAHYLLFQRFPGLRAFFVGNAEYLMNGLVDLFPVVGGDHNASLAEAFLKMAKIARHRILPPLLISPSPYSSPFKGEEGKEPPAAKGEERKEFPTTKV